MDQPPESYNLKWNLHSMNFMQTFSDFQTNESLVDVTLFCEGQCIKAHRLVLSACSAYFHNIFQAHQACQYPIIYLNGVTFKALNHILRFMYNGEVKILVSDLAQVLALGESLQVKGLCTVKMTGSENCEAPENIVDNATNNRANSSQTDGNDWQSLWEQREFEKLTEINKSLNRGLNTLTLPEVPPSTNIPTIPTPAPNAFMIFTKKQRPKLSAQYPGESRKEISIRLGNMWKNMPPEEKSTYYRIAQRREENYMLFQGSVEPLSKRTLVDDNENNQNFPKNICVDLTGGRLT